MAVTPIKVNYRSIFSNGTLTATSDSTTWNNEERIADGFISRIATTAGTPAGETIIKVDQGSVVSEYFDADRFIIPAKHNILAATVLNAEFSPDDSAWTAVSNPALEDPIAPGVMIRATFDKVVSGPGNRYWRLRFTQTNEPLEIPEVWITEQIELGISETIEDGNAVTPIAFTLRPNILVHRTLEGIRSSVERGSTLRAMTVKGQEITATAFADWETFLAAISNGLKTFFIDDPRGDTWFAEVVSIDSRDLDSPERWTITLQIQEVP